MAGRHPRRRRLPLEETPLGQNNEKIKERPYMWTSDDYMKVAKYLSEHYDEYSAASKQGKKSQFLRIMKTKLDGLESLKDTQIIYGFSRFLNKYKLVKSKVNSGGKARKPWILEQCPYFYILDATFATTPKNIIYEPETGDIGNEVTIENDEESSSEVSIVFTDYSAQQEIPEIEIDIEEGDKECSECQLIRPCTVLLRNYFDCNPITGPISVASNVKEACKNIGVGKEKMKSSIDTLIELIDSKVQDQIEVEKQKLKLEERKFAAQHALQLKKLDIDRLKVKAQSEHKAQRFAMKKAKAQQLREMKKLRLQIRLEKFKN